MNDPLDYWSVDLDTGEPIHVGRWLAEGLAVLWRNRLSASGARLAAQLTEEVGKSVTVLEDLERRCLLVQAKRLPRGSVPTEFEGLPVVRH